MTQSNQNHTPPNSQDSDQNHPEPEATDPPAEPVDIPAETDSKKVDQLPTDPPRQPANTSPIIVGLGASAGGLAALETFFKNTPPDTGLAFVVVMHLMRHHKSNLTELLQNYTRMPVAQIKDGTLVEPNHVYVIPPNRELGILNGRLQLLELTQREPAMAIDSFFRHLADDQGPRAICIILSGSGSDGALGLKAISEQGGLVIAQTPDSAEYNGMPGSAIDTGLVDLVRAPADMPPALVGYVQKTDFSVEGAKLDEKTLGQLNKIFLLLRADSGLDFSRYRPNALFRRISKRMAVHKLSNLADYVDYLRREPEELTSLYQEILIGVTQFFREPEAFEVIKTKVLPALLEQRPEGRPLRVWAPGCSTGEEAYSLAMLIHDYKQEVMPGLKIEIFATDINPIAVEKARLGEYPGVIAADVPEPFLKRYFIKQDQTYKLKSEIREMMIFADQNLLKDPPFSKLDLISCRNLLIYLKTETQRQVLALFQYALNPDGFLFLGSSENIGDFADYYTGVDRKWRIFKRSGSQAVLPPDMEFFHHSDHTPRLGADHPGGARGPAKGSQRDLLEKSLLEHYEPVGILIDAAYNILYTYGRIDRYLKLAAGEARLNIMDMLRPGLELHLPSAIRFALAQNESVTHRRVWVKTNGDEQFVDIIVKPVGDRPDQPLTLIIIDKEAPAEAAPDEPAEPPAAPVDDGADGRLQDLNKQLAVAKSRLRNAIEELQTANEEHRSFAEELQSSNEELQSTNEELTTSQEELRSVNEELVTANTEIQKKNLDLRWANNDLHNLLSATDIATIFLDAGLKIKRFTPAATKIVNVIDTDRGRPFNHIVSNFKDESLHQDLKHVLGTLNTVEREVETEAGKWFNMRIIPYRTLENVIEGVVLTFAEITAQKQVEAQLRRLNEELRQGQDYARNIVDTLHESVLLLDDTLHVVTANASFYHHFEATPQETEGNLIYELGNRQWDIPQLRELLEEIIPQNSIIEQYDIEYDFPDIGRRTMRLNARRLNRPEGEADQILLAIEDVTEQGGE